MTDTESMIMLLGEDLEREIWLTQNRGLIQGIGSTNNEEYNVSLFDVLHTIENDPPNQPGIPVRSNCTDIYNRVN
jgi:hypothetical protein